MVHRVEEVAVVRGERGREDRTGPTLLHRVQRPGRAAEVIDEHPEASRAERVETRERDGGDVVGVRRRVAAVVTGRPLATSTPARTCAAAVRATALWPDGL